MKFRCPKCSAKYKLDENKVRKSTFKMQCRKCSTWLSITIPKNKKDTEKQLVQEKPSPSQKASKKLNIPRPPKPKRKSKKTENPKGLDFENPSSESLSPKHAPGQALPPETDSSSELAIGSGLRIPVSAFNENLGDSSGTQTFIVAAGLDNNYQKKRNLMVLLTSILVLVSAGFLTSSVINSPKKEFKFKEWKKKPVITKKWGKVEISDEDKKLFAKLKDGFEDPQKKLDQEAKEKNSNTILFENAEEKKAVKKVTLEGKKVELSKDKKDALLALYAEKDDSPSLSITGTKAKTLDLDKSLSKGPGLKDLEKNEAKKLLKIIKKRMGGLEFCYNMALKKDSTLSGRILIQIWVGKSGRVNKLNLNMGKISMESFKSCIISRIKSWRLESISKDQIMVEIPYLFTSSY